MNISPKLILCDTLRVSTISPRRALGLLALAAALGGNPTQAQPTNPPAGTNNSSVAKAPAPPAKPSPATAAAAPQKQDEAAFRIIGDRNIFNANRSGGRVTTASTRRPARIETVTLVGTMAYERGAFAFFDGSSSEYSKVLQASGVIAGHKLVDVLADGVKLEADGKQFELPVGSQLRREDAGAWLVAEASSGGAGSGSNYTSARTEERSGDASSRNGRSSRSDSSRTRRSDSGSDTSARPATPTPTPAPAATPAEPSEAEKNEILKRLKERREKE